MWENDWPVIGVNAKDGCGEPCLTHKKPNTGISEQPCSLEASDEFECDSLHLMWQWTGNAEENFYSLSERPGHLRLYALNPSGKEQPVLWECANVLTQKLVCPYFKAVSYMEFAGLSNNHQAGMVMMGGQYAYLAVRVKDGNKTLVFGRAYDGKEGVYEDIRQLAELPEETTGVWFTFYMKETESGPRFSMAYGLEEGREIPVETDFMPSDHTWVGSKIGLFATNLGSDGQKGYADFEFIHVTKE